MRVLGFIGFRREQDVVLEADIARVFIEVADAGF
jgi:hypothetical protein